MILLYEIASVWNDFEWNSSGLRICVESVKSIAAADV